MNKTRVLFAAVAVLLVVVYFGMSAYLKHRTISYLNDFANYIGEDSQLQHGDVKVNPLTMNGLVNDIIIENNGLKIAVNNLNFNAISRKAAIEAIKFDGPFQSADIDKVNVNKYTIEDGIPKSTDIEVKGLKLLVPSFSNNSDGKVSVDLSIVTEADFENQLYEYKKFNISAPDLMDLDLSFAISGFDIKKYAAYSKISPEDLAKAEEFTNQITQDLATLRLNNLTMRFKDSGVVSKYYVGSDNSDNMTVEERKAEFATALDAYSESVESEFDAKLAQDVKKFILGEYSEAVLTIAPTEPVIIQSVAMSVMMGASTEELIKLLGLTYSVK
jgi:hypothetical protein